MIIITLIITAIWQSNIQLHYDKNERYLNKINKTSL